MPSGTIVADIPASPEAVWSVLTDYEDAPNWVPDLISVKRLDSGAIRPGSQLMQVMNVQGRRMDVTITITKFNEPRVIAHSGEGKSMKLSGRSEITPTATGCRVTNDWNLELSGLLRLAGPLAANWTRNNIEQSMAVLRRRFESD